VRARDAVHVSDNALGARQIVWGFFCVFFVNMVGTVGSLDGVRMVLLVGLLAGGSSRA
jgi:hypothetical protein